jgi:hypothetical protein
VSLVRNHEELREREERERETRRINSPKCSDMQRTRCDRPDTHTIYRQFTTYHTQQFVIPPRVQHSGFVQVLCVMFCAVCQPERKRKEESMQSQACAQVRARHSMPLPPPMSCAR